MDKQLEYQLVWGHVDRLVNRRQNTTTIYLSVNAAIITVVAFVLSDAPLTGWLQLGALTLLLVSGIVVCDLWRRTIIQYKELIKWWYRYLREIEYGIAGNNAMVSREYHELYEDGAGKGRVGLTRYEIRLTWLFIMLYLIFIVATFVLAFI